MLNHKMTKLQKRIITIGQDAIKNNPEPGKFNHASIICYKGKPLCVGLNNQYKTHTKASDDWPYIHSELQTILQFKRKTTIDLSDTTLYNIRIGKSGKLLMSRPCVDCTKLILAANFKNVYYTNNLGLFEEFIFR